MTYEEIVVPLDGSQLAEVALPYAEEIAAKMRCKVILLSVLQSSEANEYQQHHIYATKMVKTTKEQVKKYLQKAGDEAIEVNEVTRIGNPAKGILDYVDKGPLSLIIMATHGRSGISRWAVGSVADNVVRSTSRQPILLIRAKGAHPDMRAKRILRKALVPLDGSLGSEAVIPYVMWMAQSLQMEITLLRAVPKNNHIGTDVEAYLQSICSRFEDKGISARYDIRVGAAADTIIDLADELSIDVVAMSTHGQTTIDLWPLGSVAQKVLLGGNTPLMLVRN